MNRISFRLITIIGVILTAPIAQSQDLWSTFTMIDGLAGNYINTIIESADGTLWFGTDYGVSSYRLGDWATYRDGLSDFFVQAIFESHDGALWFGTNGGVSRYHQGKWTSFTSDSGLTNNDVRAICESKDGALWFGTDGGGASRYDNGRWKTFDTGNGLIHNRVYSIIESSDGALWFGTAGGVSRYVQGKWQSYTTINGLVDNDVHVIMESSDGILWFGTRTGVSYFQDQKWRRLTTPQGSEDNIYAITESADGVLWFGTGEYGVSRYLNGKWTSFFDGNSGLVDNHISAIIESSDESLWFGTEAGVSRLQQSYSTTFTTANGLPHNYIKTIFESSDHALWLGTFGGGVSRYENGNWTTVTTIIGNNVKTITESMDGKLWVGTENGVSFFYQDKWENFTTDSGLCSNDTRSIIASSDGSIWFGTANGVNRYFRQKWFTFTTNNGLISNSVTALVGSADGAIWVGTGKGLVRYYRGSWEAIPIPGSAADNDIQTMFEASDSALWIGTYEKGVRRLKDGIWSEYREQLPSESIHAIAESPDGALWFGTNLGVSRYWQGLWSTFTTATGLTSNYVSAILESSTGELWLGTKQGLNKIKPDKKMPKTYIIEGPQNNDIIGIATPLFTFNASDRFTGSKQLVFSWKICDKNNLQIGGDSTEFQNIMLLQPVIPENGTYTFHVRARDSWGNVDPTPASRTFTVDITPPTITVIAPRSTDVVAGEVLIIGSAYDNSPIHDFSDYELSYAPTREEPTYWHSDRLVYLKDTTDEIRDDTLAIWNTTGLPNGTYWLHLSARDTLGHISHDFVPVEIAAACQLIDARHGGYLCGEFHQITVYVPPNAIPRDQQINLKDFSLQQIEPISNPQITLLNLCFELTPNDLQLSKPATLSLNYADSLITNRNEEKLALYCSTDGIDNWQRLGGSVNLEENKITTSVVQFGVFALYEDLTAGGKASIFNVNCQPRIFSPQGGSYNTQTAISFELGKEGHITMKIYNPAGRLVRVLQEDENLSHGNNVVYWDGKDDAGNFCLSGLYIVTIEAGEKMATKTVVVVNKY